MHLIRKNISKSYIYELGKEKKEKFNCDFDHAISALLSIYK
jgi:hypothetical protein